VAECEHLLEDADRTNTLLMIAHCRRFDLYWTAWVSMSRATDYADEHG
jgi:predicted dehydrogenase